jgi:hypothetical protein
MGAPIPPIQAIYRKVIPLPWKKWFAWYPVRVHGQRTWLKTVYRRSLLTYADMDEWERYEYGTIFDVLTK